MLTSRKKFSDRAYTKLFMSDCSYKSVSNNMIGVESCTGKMVVARDTTIYSSIDESIIKEGVLEYVFVPVFGRQFWDLSIPELDQAGIDYPTHGFEPADVTT